MRTVLLAFFCLALVSCARPHDQGSGEIVSPPLVPDMKAPDLPEVEQRKFSIQGHRGAAAVFPENTLQGFDFALSAGADQIELDIQISLDGVPVVFHDAQVSDRVCRHRGGREITEPLPVRTLTVEQLKRFDCGFRQSKGAPIYTVVGAKIPTLEEVIRLVENSKYPGSEKVILKLDIKSVQGNDFYNSPQKIAAILVREVASLKVGHRVIFGSFDGRVLAEIKALKPEARLAYIFDGILTSRILEIAKTLGVHTLSPRATYLMAQGEASWIAKMKSEGFRVVPWTVNKPQAWKRLIDAGVDGILTDDPGALLDFYQTNYGGDEATRGLGFQKVGSR